MGHFFSNFFKKELLTAYCSAIILGIGPLENLRGFWALEDEISSHFSMNDRVFGGVNYHMDFKKMFKYAAYSDDGNNSLRAYNECINRI